jgi:hypothetical protein
MIWMRNAAFTAAHIFRKGPKDDGNPMQLSRRQSLEAEIPIDRFMLSRLRTKCSLAQSEVRNTRLDPKRPASYEYDSP